MGDSKDNRPVRSPGSVPGVQPGRGVPPTRGAPTSPPGGASSSTAPAGSNRPPSPNKPGSPSAAPDPKDGRSGRVVHDERGNAVWHWVKETSRIAIESTSRLLRKLEIPELKVEETKDDELRIESDRDAGGGYDPYASSSNNKRGKR
jgi:hypothetical protein